MSDAKRAKVDASANSAGSSNGVPAEVSKALDALQVQLEEVNSKAAEEILALERRYNQVRKPIYDKRNELFKNIPQFWLKAIQGHAVLRDMVTEDDENILKHLTVLSISDIDGGFRISLQFAPNDYFSDKELWKEFRYTDEGGVNVTSSNVHWSIPKGGTGANGNKRSRDESFFDWFLPEDQDHEMGECFKDELWLDPMSFYNHPEIYDDEDDDDEDEDDEDDDGEAPLYGDEQDDDGGDDDGDDQDDE